MKFPRQFVLLGAAAPVVAVLHGCDRIYRNFVQRGRVKKALQ